VTAFREALGERFECVEQIGHGPAGEIWRVWDWQDSDYAVALLVSPALRAAVAAGPGLDERLAGLTAGWPLRQVVEAEHWAVVLDQDEDGGAAVYLPLGETLRRRLAPPAEPLVESPAAEPPLAEPPAEPLVGSLAAGPLPAEPLVESPLAEPPLAEPPAEPPAARSSAEADHPRAWSPAAAVVVAAEAGAGVETIIPPAVEGAAEVEVEVEVEVDPPAAGGGGTDAPVREGGFRAGQAEPLQSGLRQVILRAWSLPPEALDVTVPVIPQLADWSRPRSPAETSSDNPWTASPPASPVPFSDLDRSAPPPPDDFDGSTGLDQSGLARPARSSPDSVPTASEAARPSSSRSDPPPSARAGSLDQSQAGASGFADAAEFARSDATGDTTTGLTRLEMLLQLQSADEPTTRLPRLGRNGSRPATTPKPRPGAAGTSEPQARPRNATTLGATPDKVPAPLSRARRRIGPATARPTAVTADQGLSSPAAKGPQTPPSPDSVIRVAGQPLWRSPLVWIGLIAVVLLVLVGLLWRFGSSEVVAAELPGEPAASGLRVDLAVSEHRAGQPADLTVNLVAPDQTGLAGEALVVVPDQPCPDQAEAGTRLVEVANGCGHAIAFDLKPGETQSQRLRLATSPGDNVAWLEAIVAATAQALADMTGQDFAPQRVTALVVVPQDIDLTVSPLGRYIVLADWSGTYQGVQPLLNVDRSEIQTSSAVDDLTGGAGIATVRLTTCPQAHIEGVELVADEATNSCVLKVGIGLLESGPARFAISGG
jgi:hypothetical protein